MAKSTKRKIAVHNAPVQNSQPKASVSRTRPTAAGILMVLGGLFIMGFAIIALSEVSYIMSHSSNYSSVINATTMAALTAQAPYLNKVSIAGVILGLSVVILGLFALFYTNILKFARYVAVAVAALSILSLFDSGGIFVGAILSVLGAILLFLYKG